MDDNFSKVMLKLMISLIVMAPLFWPEAAIILGTMVWSTVYGLFLYEWTYFDPTTYLPHFSYYNQNGWWLLCWIAGIGLLRGLPGVIAMLVVWGPMVTLAPYEVALGISVNSGKKEWIAANYQKPACEKDKIFICTYRPKAGLKLPTFVQDEVGDVGGKVLEVHAWVPKTKG